MGYGRRSAEKEARTGLITAGAALGVVCVFLVALGPRSEGSLALGLIAFVMAFGQYAIGTGRSRRRLRLLRKPFPPEWERIIEENIGFYHTLSEEGQARFRDMITVFLHEVRITGVRMEVDEELRLLIAASAVLPIYGFGDYEYPYLGDILVYPGPIKPVGVAEPDMSGAYIPRGPRKNSFDTLLLSAPAVREGWADMHDKRNVALHEFAHIIDNADGRVDGIPYLFLPKKLRKPWYDLVTVEMKKIRAGRSKLRRYGAANRAEFFAVATEYFFENPAEMRRAHPELYRMLARVFRQDTHRSYFGINFRRLLYPYGKRIHKRSACPCGSGQHFGDCCLK